MTTKQSIATIAAILLASALHAQDACPQYIIKSLTANDGLSHNSVRAIMEDRNGYVWMGTSDGLNRYDGMGIRQFSPVDGLPDNNFILSLCEDDNGTIWIGTASGICTYDPVTGQERRHIIKEESLKINRQSVYDIVKSPSGDIWIAAKEDGFIRIDPNGGRTEIYRKTRNSLVNLNKALALCFDNNNNGYFVTGDGDLYVSSDCLQSAASIFQNGEKPLAGYRIHNVNYAFGNLIIGVPNMTLIINPVTGDIRQNNRWPIIHTMITSSAELWAATERGPVIMDNDLQIKTIPSWYALNEIPGIEGRACLSICKGSGGNIWLGTFSGAMQMIPNKAQLRHFKGHHVRRFLENGDGTIWVATEDAGLFLYHPKTSIIEHIDTHLKTHNIQDICLDGDCLWIGAFSTLEPLSKMNLATGRTEVIKNINSGTTAVRRTKDGTILVGSTTGLKYIRNGVIYDVPDFRFSIHEIHIDSSGGIWISTAHDGLWRCNEYQSDFSTRHWTHYRYIPNDANSIPSDKVSSVFEDSASRIWVTTEAGGFCRLTTETGRFTRYNSANGFPFNSVYKISEDGNGLLWITTSRGLMCFNPENRKHCILTAQDGMLSTQYNFSANLMTSEGCLLAGSSDGFICFVPSLLDNPRQPSKVILSDIISGTMKFKSGASVEIPHEYNSFQIYASTISNSVPNTFRLVYRLKNLDSKWAEVSDGRITFDNVPSGHYVLQVGIRSDFSKQIEQVHSMEINIPPPLLLRWPFFILYILLLTALVAGIRRGIRHLADKKIDDNRKEAERDNEKRLMTAKMEFLTNITHEIRTPLTLIQGPLEDLKQHASCLDDDTVRENLDTLQRNTDRLAELICQVQDFRSISSTKYSLNISECNIIELFDTTLKRFTLTAKRKKIRLDVSYPDAIIGQKAFIDPEALKKIMNNLLSNAIKYTGSYIKINISTDDESFYLIVENDGQIVPVDMREEIFKPFVRYVQKNYAVAGTGIGLANSREFAELMGGNLRMDDDDKVNRFILSLPLVFKKKVYESTVAGNTEGDKSDGRKKILIVEDSEDMKNFILNMLKDDFAISAVADGAAALDIVGNDFLPDLILSDIMMAGIDGLELCRRIKADPKTCHIPVVLLTAKSDMGSKIEGMDCGADLYIEKPFSIDYLKTSLHGILKNRDRVKSHFKDDIFPGLSFIDATPAEESFMKRVDNFITMNLSNDSIKVEDMAKATYTSVSTLQRKLRQQVNMSVKDYIQFCRLKKAAQILREEDISIAEVSDKVGFGSHSYFSSCFRRQFGVNPKEFKNGK